MRVREKNATRSESIEVRRDRLWMATHAADPIIQVVHCNEQYIWAGWIIRTSEWHTR